MARPSRRSRTDGLILTAELVAIVVVALIAVGLLAALLAAPP
jgi:hypothetical protein